MISSPQPYTSPGRTRYWRRKPCATTDPATSQKYFYVYFPEHCWISGTTVYSGFTYSSVARAPYEELPTKIFLENSATAPRLFHKYYNGQWDEPGMGGMASELFPAVTGETDGDPQWYGAPIAIVLWRSWITANTSPTGNPRTA